MRNLFATFAACASLSSAFAGGEGWIQDFDAAKKEAAAKHEDILLDFTGSDWCSWCIKLNKEVFSQKAFKDGVKDKFILTEIDFPRKPENIEKIPENIRKQNEELEKKFHIEGYPTIILCDASGKPYARTGYQEGGAEKYVARLDELRTAREKRDAAFAEAAKLEDPLAKANKLVEGLKAMDDETVDASYGDVIDQITALDKDGSIEWVKERKEKAAKQAAAEAAEGKVQDFVTSTIRPLMEGKKYDEAREKTLAFVKENPGLNEDMKIGLSLQIGLAGFVEKGDSAGASKYIDEIVAAYPDSELKAHADEIKESVNQQIDHMKAASEEGKADGKKKVGKEDKAEDK